MPAPLRLLTIGHSYCVALNRRIAHEILRESEGRWQVTVVAPSEMRGDLRPTPFEPIRDEPCRVEVVPVYWPEHIHFMLWGTKLRQILREPWDLIHAWEEPYILPGAQVALWAKAGTPLLYYTFQNLKKSYPWPFSTVERYALSRSTGWIAAGKTIEETLMPSGAGYAQKPHRILPLGVDTDLFRPDTSLRATALDKLGWSEAGPPVIGFLGRLVPEKGLGLLTRVLDRIELPWRAVFIGAGPEENVLRGWAASKEGRVRMFTNVRHAEVPTLLNSFDILCAPSQTAPHWREQFGRMLIEAFATAVPVIASDSGEIPYVVGDAGIIAAEKDETAWETAIRELLKNPDRRHALGVKGLKRARSEFAWPVVARKHVEFFDEIVAMSHQ